MSIEIEVEKFEARKLDTVKIAKESMPELGITATRYEGKNENGKTAYLVEIKFELQVPKGLQEDLGKKVVEKEVDVLCKNEEESCFVIRDLMML